MERKSDEIKFGGISKVSLPFYEPPPRKTSAEIINEARLAIRGTQKFSKFFFFWQIRSCRITNGGKLVYFDSYQAAANAKAFHTEE